MSEVSYYPLYYNQIISIYKQCLITLQFLHSMNIYHGDIKQNNIMIQKNTNRPIIIDFDLSNISNISNFRNKDIWNLTAIFLIYFIPNAICDSKLNPDFDLIESYEGKYKSFVNILFWILCHSLRVVHL